MNQNQDLKSVKMRIGERGMDNEQYFAKKRAEYKEFILDKINTRSEQFGDFGDLETRSMYLISMQP